MPTETELLSLKISLKTEGLEKKLKLILDQAVVIAAERIARGAREAVLTSQNPFGEPFLPLKQATLEDRRRRGIRGVKPLLATGKLLESVRVVHLGKGRSSVVLDAVAIYHQFGTSRGIPPRKVFPERNGKPVLPEAWVQDVKNSLKALL